MSDSKPRFEFPDASEPMDTDDLRDIDDPLLSIFRQWLEEVG